jgi:hypothetical protein
MLNTTRYNYIPFIFTTGYMFRSLRNHFQAVINKKTESYYIITILQNVRISVSWSLMSVRHSNKPAAVLGLILTFFHIFVAAYVLQNTSCVQMHPPLL